MNTPVFIAEKRSVSADRPDSASASSAWRTLGYFGAALAVIGAGQMAIYLYPASFASPEWKFGAMAQVLGSLPLTTMGLAAVLAAAVAGRSRPALLTSAAVLTVLLILTAAALFVFWSVVPLALQSAPGPTGGVMRQTVARTTLSGVGFGLIYLFGAVVALLRARRPTS